MTSGLQLVCAFAQWCQSPLRFGLLWAMCGLLTLVFSLTYGQPARAVDYAEELSVKLNPTGRTVTLPVPLKDETQDLGEVVIQITASDAIFVEKAGLLQALSGVIDAPIVANVEALPDKSGYIDIAAFSSAGLGLTFDTGLQELQLTLAADQRPVGDLSVGGRLQQPRSSVAIAPEEISGYVNVVAGLDQTWNASAGGIAADDNPGARLELDSVVRLRGAVFESRSVYDGAPLPDTCPDGAICTYGHAAGLKRQSTHLIYDFPEEEVRVTLGDAEPVPAGVQRTVDLLGVAIEKSPRKLNPGESISATGTGSFRLDRNATVEVRVNGVIVQQFNLRAGTYNLRDLPLTTGANNIELVIEDASGERRTLAFSLYSAVDLLAEGKSEWSVATGVPSYLLDDQRVYASGDWMASAFYRYGFTDDVTGLIDAQADLDVVMAGAGVTTGTPWGVFGAYVAGSTGDLGSGVAANLSWSYTNFSALTSTRDEGLQFLAEFRSTDFHTPGDEFADADGIIFPEQPYWLRLSAAYSFPVYDAVVATVSGRYQFDNSDQVDVTQYQIVGDRYGADVTVSAPLSDTTSGSLTLGYSNELYPAEGIVDVDPEFRAALRLTMRPWSMPTTYIAGGYDTLGNQAQLSAYRTEGSGIGRWDTTIAAQAQGYNKEGSVMASVGYWGNRAELRLSHFSDFDDLNVTSFEGTPSQQRTTVRVGTALAFAGNKVAIGAPVRGGAFAIVTPHDSLGDREVTVGNNDVVTAQADQWGNALVSDIPAYLPSSTGVAVEDLPLGYSLGSGSFDTFAPYRAGYVFEVGSNNSVTAYGTLERGDGTPLALLTGTAKPSQSSAPPVTVFTNALGRFGAEGLAPGTWIIEMAADEGPITYELVIPENANGLVKVGTLRPTGGAP